SLPQKAIPPILPLYNVYISASDAPALVLSNNICVLWLVGLNHPENVIDEVVLYHRNPVTKSLFRPREKLPPPSIIPVIAVTELLVGVFCPVASEAIRTEPLGICNTLLKLTSHVEAED